MMKKIFQILPFFFSLTLFGQSPNTPPITFASRFQITNVANGTLDTLVISGYVDDCSGRFTNSNIAIGDSLYVLEGADLLIFGVVSTRTISLGIATFKVKDFNGAGLNPSNGQAAIFEPTTNLKLPSYVCGLRDDLQQFILNRQAQLLDNLTATQQTYDVAATSHGYTSADVGKLVYLTGANAVKLANADYGDADSVAQWVISSIVDANNLELCNSCFVTFPSTHGITQNSYIWLGVTPGSVLDTATTGRNIQFVGKALDTIRAYFQIGDIALGGSGGGLETLYYGNVLLADGDTIPNPSGTYLPLAGGTMTGNILLTENKLIGGSTTTSDLYLQTTTGAGATGADMHFLVGNNGATEAMTILNSGIVGIGTGASTNPNIQFNILRQIADATVLGLQGGTSPGTDAVFTFKIGDTGASGLASKNMIIRGTSTASDIAFSAASGTLTNPQLVLKADGKVGVNTTSPSARLDVLGVTQATTGTTGAFLSTQTSNATSGTLASNSIVGTFASAAGSASYRPLSIAYTINNSGAQSGRATGIFLNATETSLNSMTHNLMDLQVGGSSKFNVNNLGQLYIDNAKIKLGANGFLTMPSNGVLRLTDLSETTFNRIAIGGITSLFPAIKRNGTGIDIRLADDSANAPLTASTLALDKTVTPSGTTGNQTINKPIGTVNFAAASTTLTVTNSLVTTSSIIVCTALKNDATGYVKSVSPSAGSFVITLVAAATAELPVSFIVLN